MSQEDIKCEVLVVGANRGGIIVSVDHIRGFIPGSHLTQVDCCASLQYWMIGVVLQLAEGRRHQAQPHLLTVCCFGWLLCETCSCGWSHRMTLQLRATCAPHRASAAAPFGRN